MPYDHDQIANLDAAIDGLDSPTTLETWQATDPYDAGMVAASAVRRALAGGVDGGAAITDEIMEFVGGALPPTFPITAIHEGADPDIDPGIVTVTGDCSSYFPAEIISLGIVSLAIEGSTGNDSSYTVASSVYNSGTNKTTITLNGGVFSDATADGNVQPAYTQIGQVVLLPQSSVEWVLFVVDEAFDFDFDMSNGPYVWVGDIDDGEAFSGGDTAIVDNSGVYQWPTKTLDANGTIVSGSASGLKYYPDGTTITVLVSGFPNSDAGSMRVTVHHHFDETVVVTVAGPA